MFVCGFVGVGCFDFGFPAFVGGFLSFGFAGFVILGGLAGWFALSGLCIGVFVES